MSERKHIDAERQPLTSPRTHFVLVPGFVGFDALGQLSYYAGVTRLFTQWKQAADDHFAVLHYFNNFPTASVAVRAERLRGYLAARVARGEFARADRVVLIGHSTGALDIRKTVSDLAREPDAEIDVDANCTLRNSEVLARIAQLVFLSAPHYGTNLADFACSVSATFKGMLTDAGLALQLNRDPIAVFRRRLARLVLNSRSDLLLAIADALNESDENRAGSATQRANEREARAHLALWLEHMGQDFQILTDLRSASGVRDASDSPAHASQQQRAHEMAAWREHGITTCSYVTFVPKPQATFAAGWVLPALKASAPVLNTGARLLNAAADRWWLQPASLSAMALRAALPALATPATLQLLRMRPAIVFEAFYALCADPNAPFRHPNTLARDSIAPFATRLSGERVATDWLTASDSDGVVNTLSMLWPYEPEDPSRHRHVLLEADHGDIIGHFQREPRPNALRNGRAYDAYDIFPSGSHFDEVRFRAVWLDVFDTSAGRRG